MKEFTIYKRGNVYYGVFPDKRTGKKKRVSTGCTSKAKAKEFCGRKAEELKTLEGALQDARFSKLAAGWWIPGLCPYIKESSRNGVELSPAYIRTSRALLERYILPEFGRMRISGITSGDIDEWKYGLHEKHGLGGKSVNNYLSVLRTMFDYWWRHGIIRENPCIRVRRMRSESAPRGILTTEEAALLFSRPEIWNNPAAYLANLLAACTGMRMGEIQALRYKDVSMDNVITVKHSWDEYSGIKSTKTGVIRSIPVTLGLVSLLTSGCTDPEAFIFSLDNPAKPVYRSCILDGLRDALERIGISRDEQRERNAGMSSSCRRWRSSGSGTRV